MNDSTATAFPELREVIDHSKMNTGQYLVILLCFLLNIADGFDVLAMSYAAPALSSEWSVEASALGVIFSAALAGMTTGAIFLSPLSDRFGRRRIILFSVALTGISMLATTQATTISQLVMIRFSTGLGIGGILASAAALTSEYASLRFRSFAVITVTAGYSVGSVLAGPLTGYIIPLYGWQQVFLIGGIFTSVLFVLSLIFLPESIEYVAAKKGDDGERLTDINRLLKRIGKPELSTLSNGHARQEIKQGNVAGLFHPDFRKVTAQLWTILFTAYWSAYFLMNWIPTLFVNSGYTKQQGIFALTMYTLGGLAGALLVGYLSTRIQLAKLISNLFFMSAALLGLCALAGVDSLWQLNAVVLIVGFAFTGGFTGLYAVIAQNYPTEIRTTGVGWGIGLGRFGAILSPLVAGILVGNNWGMYDLFLVVAVPPLVISAWLIWKLPKPIW